jgi:tetratricopeptide (TPR) repeat protein
MFQVVIKSIFWFVLVAAIQASLILMPFAQEAPVWPKSSAHSTEEIRTLKEQVTSRYEAGRYAEAIPMLQRLLALQEKTLGPEHLEVAYSLYYLAESLNHEGRLAEAEPLYTRALAIGEKTLGPEHPTSQRR